MHSTFDWKCHSYTGYPFRDTKKITTRAGRINWKAHMHALNHTCVHDASSLLPRKVHIE